MNLWQSLGGMVEVELLSADLPGVMAAMGKANIDIQDAICSDQLHLRFFIPHSQLTRLDRLAEKKGAQLNVLHRRGLFYDLKGLFNRPVLTVGLLGLLAFSLWIPTRVFFVQVEGNDAVAANKIIEVSSQCGIGFGASRREVRSEKVKNALLSAMPELQWAGVNTYGCRAVITVRERKQPQTENEKITVSSIVALRDAVVREMTVLKGNALCKPGQAVKKGEVLISGYTDCGICIQATDAKGEIYGDTEHRLTTVFPTQYLQRTKISASSKKYSLIIGKNRINFFKGSGISGTTCAKIYEQKYLTLPGGFQLPIAIAWEQWFDYETQFVTAEEAEKILSDFAASYLPEQMQAGKIIMANELFFQNESHVAMEGIYSCYEMIGITRPEERLNE